ncbi:hypothetical protein [Methylobrevis pamukkalensis]|uniref:Uncharacterized protein n=1 Tax=Methylobrevis pamukkalensis TaxID=1439726 RepID=A0A1E3H5T7_9HYPH|nr:hypothetical protein [Methylobrevis pamukkalensis]ODN71166.1 hypothetical protein A6302_01455 [Methylobrevis pamukkalensis]
MTSLVRAVGSFAFDEVEVPSAPTCDLGAAIAQRLVVTGSAAITSFGTVPRMIRHLRFAGALTLTHSAGLALPGGANIVTAAGDTATAMSDALGAWRVTSYTRADGRALTGPTAAMITDAARRDGRCCRRRAPARPRRRWGPGTACMPPARP